MKIQRAFVLHFRGDVDTHIAIGCILHTHINTEPNTHPKHVPLHVRSVFVWVQKCVLVCERARLLMRKTFGEIFPTRSCSLSLARSGSSQISGTQHSLEMPTERRENHRSHFNQHPFVHIWSTSWTKLCTNNLASLSCSLLSWRVARNGFALIESNADSSFSHCQKAIAFDAVTTMGDN